MNPTELQKMRMLIMAISLAPVIQWGNVTKEEGLEMAKDLADKIINKAME